MILKIQSKKNWIRLILFSIWLVSFFGFFGRGGLIQAHRLSQVRQDILLRTKALENEKLKMLSAIRDLEHDDFYQEKMIRDSIGFVRPDELIFEFQY